jgi:DNA-binding transcriptional LysR family regulator
MDTTNLTIFVQAMRKRSFVAVARDRGVDPATISRAIAALEEELQLRLFQRTTRKIEPTEAGVVYFERIEPLVDELERAKLLASDVSARPEGVLRIACPVSFAELNIIPLLPEFARLYPELRYELVLTDAILDLIAERLDVAIRVGSLPDSSLIVHKLSPMISRVCATPQYLKEYGTPQTPPELINHRCLLLALTGFSRSNWKFTDKEGGVQEIVVGEYVRTSNAMALKQCALAGMGITLQAKWMIGRELKEGKLVDLFPDYEVTAAIDDAAAWLLYPSREYLPLKVRVFVEFLKQKFKNGSPWEQF